MHRFDNIDLYRYLYYNRRKKTLDDTFHRAKIK